MANSISYASKYAPELDKMIVQVAKTGIFADNAMKAKFSGAKDVYIPELSMVGLGNYDRVNGYAKGDATLTHTKYTLSQERSRQLFIDAQDADESGVPDLAGQMVGEYTRTQVVPEIDAYAISKIFGEAKAENVKTFAQATAVADMLASINGAEAATGYDGGASLIAFVDPTMYALLMNSPELTRSITINEFKKGEVNVKVRNLNGCDIIPVAANRMKSAFTFNAGSSASAGGFTPTGGAKNINALVLPRDSASLVKKVDKVDMYAPSDVIDRDGYVINFRLYYDLFVKNSRKGTIFAIAGE